jgi:hypothetical protein
MSIQERVASIHLIAERRSSQKLKLREGIGLFLVA